MNGSMNKYVFIALSIMPAFSYGASTVTASKDYVDRKTVIGTVTNADVGVVGYTVGTNTNVVFASTNYVAKKSGNAKADLITDGTNIIDAAGNVYETRGVGNEWTLVSGTDFGGDLSWRTSEVTVGWYAYGLEFGYQIISTNYFAVEITGVVEGILDDEYHIDTNTWRRANTENIIVGRLALTNDIPAITGLDFTTNNAQLVETIEATAPAPGNYAAVSNAAMNARRATDLGVRGAPLGEGSWFKVKMTELREGYSSLDFTMVWNSSDGRWGDDLSIYKTEEGYCITDGGYDIYFTLDDDFSSEFTDEDGNYHYSVAGYTNTLAQVSQIPDVPSASDATPLMDGTASAGTTNTFARGDHVHPSDTSKMDGEAAYPLWVDVTEYDVGYVVSYKGALYRCKSVGNQGIAPVSTYGPMVWDGDVSIKTLKQDALPYQTNAIPYDVITGGPVVSPSDPTFSNAVLSVGLNIDTNTVAAINALVEQGEELPIGGAAGVGALLVAIAAAVAALKRGKASLSDLPYSLVTAAQTGDWQFSDGETHTISVDEYDPGGQNPWAIVADGITPIDNVIQFQTKAEADAELEALTSCSFVGGGGSDVTATRAWELQDRAVNAVSLSADATLQLPAAVAGKSRDLLVRLTVSADAAATFSAPSGETVTWDDAGSPTATYEAGTHLLRFAEVAPGVFHFTDLGDGGSIDPAVLNGKLEATSAAPAFDPTKTYSVGEHVTYEGVLYECSTAVTTAGAWTGSTNWTATDMTSPDATLDLMADGRLRLVSADGEVLWMQGYGLASASSVTLSCDRVNFHAFAAAPAFDATASYAANDVVAYDGVVYVFTAAHAAGAWTGSDASVYAVALAMPTAPSGKVGDFVLDVDNTANASASATATLTGAGTAFDVFTPEGVNLSTDILTFAGGEQCELYFTMTAFGTAAKPAWKVVKQIVEKQEFGS